MIGNGGMTKHRCQAPRRRGIQPSFAQGLDRRLAQTDDSGVLGARSGWNGRERKLEGRLGKGVTGKKGKKEGGQGSPPFRLLGMMRRSVAFKRPALAASPAEIQPTPSRASKVRGCRATIPRGL
jgi:hypothetical protein